MPHEDCYIYEHCGADDCPGACEQRKRDAARAPLCGRQWSQLQPPTGRGAWGGYWHLDGERICCGAGLELQVVTTRDDDYGSFLCYLDQGVPVRYELGWDGAQRVPELYAAVGGYAVSFALRPGMRFRWPAKGGA